VQQHFGYHHVALFTVDAARGELAMRARAGSFVDPFPLDHRLKLGQGMVGWVGSQGEQLLSNDVRTEPHYVNLYPDVNPTCSELSVPVRVGEEIVGVLDVQSPRLNAFTENDVTVIETVAGQIAVAIQNARLYEAVRQELSERQRAEEALRKAHGELEMRIEERTADLVRTSEVLRLEIAERWRAEEALQQRNRELTLLNQASQAFSSTLDLDQVLAIVLEGVRRLLNVAACSVWLTDPATGELVCRQVADPQDQIMRGWRLAPGQGIAGRVAHHGESRIVPDTRADPRHVKSIDQHTRLEQRSLLCVPLRVKEGVIGVLEAMDTAVGRFQPADQVLIESLAASAAIAIENARLFAAVSEQHEQLRALTARLAEAEEAERQRLAQELHDQVGQNLTALGINLSILRDQYPSEMAGQVAPRLEDCLALVAETTERIRDVMADLRPPVLDDYGLVAALRWCGERVAARTDLAVNVQGEEPDPRLTVLVEIALFRIAQEALTNVVKHAQATQVTVAVELPAVKPATVRLVVADDGVGFDLARRAERRGWGLITMTERAEAVGGRCCVESSPGAGTQVVVEVPR
jgi:signal transduction histidine kinase